ncbi:MAG: nucleotide exchange factor GrpE [Ignavibacteriaceae bacterium]|nr:nucleotide exchange factor GrpE [Ignavibacteriaceae bacterium]
MTVNDSMKEMNEKEKPEEQNSEAAGAETPLQQEGIPSLNTELIDEIAYRDTLKQDFDALTAKYNELAERTELAEKNYEEANGKYMRLRAEFDNYKRRTQQEKEQDFKYAAESFLRKLIPVVDDFDRSMQFVESGADPAKLAEGIKLVYDKLQKTLAEEQVKKFESLHKPFDVEYHIALMKQPSAEHPTDTVVQEFLPGYMYKDKILRHAQVVVSEHPEEAEAQGSGNTENGTSSEGSN